MADIPVFGTCAADGKLVRGVENVSVVPDKMKWTVMQ